MSTTSDGTNRQAVPAAGPDPAQVASQRLTTPSGRHSHALGGPKPKKRRNKKPYTSDDSQGGHRGRRIILPESNAASTSAGSGAAGPSSVGGPVPKQPRARKKLKSGRKSLASQGKAFKQGGPATPSQDQRTAGAPSPQQDEFVAVATRTGETAFTRPRGDALNSSIASGLGRRPAELLEEHERELRTKRQKTAADALRSAVLADSDDEDEESPSGVVREGFAAAFVSTALDGGEMPGWTETSPLVGVFKSTETPVADMTDADDEAEGLIIVEVTEGPAASGPGHEVEKVACQEPSLATMTLTNTVEAGEKADPSASIPAQLEMNRGTAIAAAAEATNADEELMNTSTLTPSRDNRAVAADPFSSLSKALPLIHGAHPKLTSATSVLAGKRRKKKSLKLKRAPQLFDYLSDEMSDDWERKEDKYKTPKRSKNGKAVDGRLDETDDISKSGVEGSGSGSIAPGERIKLVPTSYQAALLERAKTSNILTVLSTGAGKTLVAVLLIEHQHAQEALRLANSLGAQRRMIFFLTNSVPLVHQQADVLARNTSLRVGKLFGALGVNLCSPTEWAYNLDTYDCLVVTSQLLLDSLAHGFLRMDQILLLVFDEAHHAKSHNPYASILRDFYHRAPLHQRPRILGLTASPIDSSQGVREARKLEALLDAKLVTAPAETQAELRSMVARPTVVSIDYDAAPAYSATDLHSTILDKVVIHDDSFARCLASSESVLRVLGPDAADLVWHLALQRYKSKLLPHVPESSDEEDLEDDDALQSRMADTGLDDSSTTQPTKPVIETGREARKLTRSEEKRSEIKREKERMKRELREKALAQVQLDLPDWLKIIEQHKPTLEYERLSPKLQRLLDLLKVCKPASRDFRGIVFVERRVDALVISETLKVFAKQDDELDWLRVECVTGHGVSRRGAMDPRMPWHRQASTLASFAAGEYNLLIATSVCEEGMDIQPCNFIVRFDLYNRHISMIQSKGRARAPGSHYVLFCEKGNVEEKRKLVEIARFDEGMAGLFEDNLDRNTDVDDGQDFYGLADERCTYYTEPATGATITPHSALSLLQRYSASLPRSDEFSVGRPEYTVNDFGVDEFGERQFSCTVILPSASKVRVVTGPLCASSRVAKREAAFCAVKVLRNVGSLDVHLLPLRTLPPEGRGIGHWRGRRIKEPSSRVRPKAVHYGGAKGEMTRGSQLYRPLLLLTLNEVPDLPAVVLYLDGEAVNTYAKKIGRIASTSTQRAVLTDFQVELWQSVLNKRIRVGSQTQTGSDAQKLDLVYYVALPKANEWSPSTCGTNAADLVDWSAMARAVDEKDRPIDWKNLTGLEDSTIIDQAKNGCRYFFERVMPDLRPHGPLPAGRQSDAGCSTLMEYYLSFNEVYFHSFHVSPDQPLLELSKIPKNVTHLTRTPRNDVAPNTKKLVSRLPRLALPQTCVLHPLHASAFRTALLLPSFLSDLEQRCLVNELNDALFDGKLAHEHLRTALTSPSAAVGGLDYNRLELLGDSILKHLVSTFVYVSQERTTHEGIMHRLRLELVNNRYLFEAGKRHEVPLYLVTKPFTSRHFVPPNLVLLDEKDRPPPPVSTVIGDKTIADSVEALIGAAVETGFDRSGLGEAFSLGLMAIKNLGIDIGTVTTVSDFSRLYGPPAEKASVTSDLRKVETVLGYTFQHASLLQEAFTHPSKLDMVSFERAEWLGDSVLDFHVVRYCWARWGGDLGPGHLTELKGGCVANETLAALAVELDLDRFLIYDHPQLDTNMRLYRERVVAAKEKELREAAEEAREPRPYWLTADPPKAVADIIESLFGAVYIDSAFDPLVPQQVFDKILAPFFARWISPTKLKIDAIRVLLEAAQGAQCDDVSHVSTNLDARFDPRTGELVQRLTRCSVVAHNMVLATVETANAKTAKRLASADALAYIQQNPGFFPSVCDCPSRRAVAKELALEEIERRRQEGLLSEPETDGSDEEAVEDQ